MCSPRPIALELFAPARRLPPTPASGCVFRPSEWPESPRIAAHCAPPTRECPYSARRTAHAPFRPRLRAVSLKIHCPSPGAKRTGLPRTVRHGAVFREGRQWKHDRKAVPHRPSDLNSASSIIEIATSGGSCGTTGKGISLWPNGGGSARIGTSLRRRWQQNDTERRCLSPSHSPCSKCRKPS